MVVGSVKAWLLLLLLLLLLVMVVVVVVVLLCALQRVLLVWERGLRGLLIWEQLTPRLQDLLLLLLLHLSALAGLCQHLLLPVRQLLL